MSQEKKEEEDLSAIEDSIDASIQRLENYIQKRGGILMTPTRINTDNMRTNRTTITNYPHLNKYS